jgi:molybdopterin-dependent oxidoreductase alpha subunit
MPRSRVSAAGGFAALAYSWKKARSVGGVRKLYARLGSKNACKTCAYGMGGQQGGMVNEQGSFPEVCKKSIQAQAGDMQAPLADAFFRDHSIGELETWSSRRLEHAGRLAFPIAWRDGDTHFRRVDWDTALDAVARSLLESSPDSTFFYSSGRSSNEAAFLMQMFARSYGSPNIHNCSSYCHQASSVALGRMVGTGTSTLVLDDLDAADLAIVAGANPASNHPRLIVKLVEIRERGGTVIVVNPVRELGLVRFRIPSRPRSLLFGSDVSDIYLQPHIGSDIACFTALLKGVIERGGIDSDFIQSHVEGWHEVEAHVRGVGWHELIEATGLVRTDVDRAVDALLRARRGVMLWAMGLTHHDHGVQNVMALANLALARGWVGREGCGLLPVRGHSNVQGVGSMGFTPGLKQAFASRMADAYGRSPAPQPGLDTYRSMEAAHAGRIDVAVQLGGNLFGSSPDRKWSATAFRRIGTTCTLSTTLNEGHVHGRGRQHIILPVLARDEERQSTTQESMFNFVRLSVGGEAPPGDEVKSEVEIVCALAARVLPTGQFPFDVMTDHAAVRREMTRVVPGYEPVADIGESGAEFQIAGRTLHRPVFPTASGKARAFVISLPTVELGPDEFRLTTIRSEGQFNTVVYEDEDLYRGVTRRDVVMMSAADALRLRLRENDSVDVVTTVGRMRVVVACIDIPPGNLAMYYPEANAIVPRRIDPESGTPAFKNVTARLETVQVQAPRL